ncbi:MAG: hypothetical protein Q8L14_41685 [Myxococcales bacterium]|nr:hypothetical protein [Myxococcales bacterium]
MSDELPPSMGKVALRALEAHGVLRLRDAAALTKDELRGMHGVGPKAIRVLTEALAEQGLGLKVARKQK